MRRVEISFEELTSLCPTGVLAFAIGGSYSYGLDIEEIQLAVLHPGWNVSCKAFGTDINTSLAYKVPS